MLSLLHSLLFAFAFEATLLVLGLFLSHLFELLVSRPTSLTAESPQAAEGMDGVLICGCLGPICCASEFVTTQSSGNEHA